MTSSLRERAASMAGRDEPAAGETPAAGSAPATGQQVVDELPDIEVDASPDGPEQVPVHVAWSRVMGDIRTITKSEEYKGGGTRFNFRGIDRTVNAFAPVLRKHGVLVLPVGVSAAYRDTTSKQGSQMRECVVTVRWMIIGPAGDTFPQPLETAGEALDSADKGTAKAQSVALRVLLLTGGMVASGDPDPDSTVMERGEAPLRSANSYRDEIVDPATSYGRIKQIGQELGKLGLLGALVVNETGDEESLKDLGRRMLAERSGGAK